jgi:YidC/Oxa1 family membrane protein insertase
MTDQKNTILAIVLSALVLIAWQYFIGMPQMEKQRQEAQLKQQQQQQQTQTPAQPAPAAQGGVQPQLPGQGAAPTISQALSRDAVIKAQPRVMIDTPLLRGSIALKGAQIDDLALTKYRETVDPKSPPIVLLSPTGTHDPFYAEFGWTGAAGGTMPLPTSETVWTQAGAGTLGVGRPVTLTYDNGQGLEFRRTIAVDDKYLFTVKDDVANASAAPVTLHPYALISRHGTPHTLGYYILHEGLIGVLDNKLEEVTYSKIDDKKTMLFDTTNAWLGITDKYWAAALLPETNAHLKARFAASALGNLKTYQTDYLLDAQTIAPGATGTASSRLFAGAKETATVDAYDKQLGLNKFELVIDWGWFHFITKPMFYSIDFLYRLVGNFGVAILIITVIIKGIFFPLANKS